MRRNIWYLNDRYQSHNRVGTLYKELLSVDHNLTGPREHSDIVILHNQPWNYAALYEKFRWLRDKYVICYCTWEASHLPDVYKASLALVQEVWTCSAYCATVIAPHHPRVFVVPHAITRDTRRSQDDDLLMKRAIGYDPRHVYYLNFGDTLGSRKNTHNLASWFATTAAVMPRARLVVVGDPNAPWLRCGDRRVVHIPLRLSDAQINCLYSLASAYVSAHHSEGWGLTLSDATLFDLPTIATGFSGNLEFMRPDNSFLIPAKEVFINKEQVYHLFTSDMKWGDPDYSALVERMTAIYNDPHSPDVLHKIQRARQLRLEFSPSAIRMHLNERLAAISI